MSEWLMFRKNKHTDDLPHFLDHAEKGRVSMFSSCSTVVDAEAVRAFQRTKANQVFHQRCISLSEAASTFIGVFRSFRAMRV